jgi:hypothetical protein
MAGLQNKRNSGTYIGPHNVMLASPVGAAAMGAQQTQVGGGSTLFENSHLDTLGTPMAVTGSMPLGAAMMGITCGPGNGVTDYSSVFIVDGHATVQSGTKKLLYGGNCPLSAMATKSSAKATLYVAG